MCVNSSAEKTPMPPNLSAKPKSLRFSKKNSLQVSVVRGQLHKKFKYNFILNSTLLYIAAQLSSPTKRKMCLQLSLSFACHLVKFTAHSYAGGGKSGGGSAAWASGLAAGERRRLGGGCGGCGAAGVGRECLMKDATLLRTHSTYELIAIRHSIKNYEQYTRRWVGG